jgi:hypothetical protein
MKRLLITVFLLCLVNGILQAYTPSQINYQGRYRESGQPISGNRSMEFKIWSTSTGGTTPLWDSGVLNIYVSTGLYCVNLTPAGVNWTQGYIYMETTINGTTFPREQIGSVIYALHANESESIFTSSSSSTFTVNGYSIVVISSGTVTINGNIQINGESNITPPGTIMPFGGTTPPSGWLLCDGSTYNYITYPQYATLAGVIGTIYGGSPGSTFKVPNLTGKLTTTDAISIIYIIKY